MDSPAHSEPEGWAAIQNSLTNQQDEPTGAFRNSTAIEVKPCTWAGITPGNSTSWRSARRTWGWEMQQAEQEPGVHPGLCRHRDPLLNARQFHSRALWLGLSHVAGHQTVRVRSNCSVKKELRDWDLFSMAGTGLCKYSLPLPTER